MKNILNLFKNRLNILFCLVFILLFTPILTANEPAKGKSVGCVERSETQQSNPQSEVQNPQLDKASFARKTAKLHMPFIANNDQVDSQVKFYAKTFGGTVFVTKEGEIVYALPERSEGQDEGVRDREAAVGEVSYGPRLTENGIRSNPNVLDFS